MEPNPGTNRVVIVPGAGKPRVKRAPTAAPVRQYGPGEHVPWTEFRPKLVRDLEPTERTAGLHWSLLVGTRGGKTTMATRGIIPVYEQYEVPVLVIDSTADPKLKKYGGKLPRIGKMTGVHRLTVSSFSRASADEIYKALARAMSQGDMVVYIDEIRHVADPKFLGLGMAVEHIYLFGGKHGLTMGAATQAPRWVPSSFYDQAKVHFLGRVRDDRARKRTEEISGDTATLRDLIPTLDKYVFAVVDPAGDVTTTKLDYREPSSKSR